MVDWTASGKQQFEKLGDSIRALTDQVNAGEKTANDGFEKSSKDLTDQADRVEESLRALTDQVNAGEKTANDGFEKSSKDLADQADRVEKSLRALDRPGKRRRKICGRRHREAFRGYDSTG